jgi:hypothetical protein
VIQQAASTFIETTTKILVHQGYNYDGSKIEQAINETLGEMNSLQRGTFIDYMEQVDEDGQIDDSEVLEFEMLVTRGMPILAGFVMKICPDWALDKFMKELEAMDNE